MAPPQSALKVEAKAKSKSEPDELRRQIDAITRWKKRVAEGEENEEEECVEGASLGLEAAVANNHQHRQEKPHSQLESHSQLQLQLERQYRARGVVARVGGHRRNLIAAQRANFINWPWSTRATRATRATPATPTTSHASTDRILLSCSSNSSEEPHKKWRSHLAPKTAIPNSSQRRERSGRPIGKTRLASLSTLLLLLLLALLQVLLQQTLAVEQQIDEDLDLERDSITDEPTLLELNDLWRKELVERVESGSAKPVQAQLGNNNTNVNANANSSSALDLMQQTEGPQASEFERRLVSWISFTNLIICLVGMCGNSIVILVILEFTKFGTVNDIYILNLAFADLMFVTGLIFLIITMHLEIWIFGNAMCKIFMSTTSINQFASSLLLVVMSFDRFLAVCHPIYAQRFRQPRRAKIICLCIWIVCLILQTPVLIFARTDDQMTCAIFWPESTDFNCERAFTMYSFAIGFSLPLLLIAGFYLRVVQRLRLAATSGTLHAPSSRRHRSNRRIERLVIVIICTYVICWMPYWITQISVSYTMASSQPPSFWLFIHIGTSLSYTNSALNPILYAFLSDNFKRRCADILPSISRVLACFCCGMTRMGSGYSHPNNANHANHTNHTNNTNTCGQDLGANQPLARMSQQQQRQQFTRTYHSQPPIDVNQTTTTTTIIANNTCNTNCDGNHRLGQADEAVHGDQQANNKLKASLVSMQPLDTRQTTLELETSPAKN